MAKPNRGPRPIISDRISDAAGQIIVDGLDAGFTIDEMAPDTGPKIRGESRFNQEALDEVHLINLNTAGHGTLSNIKKGSLAGCLHLFERLA